MSGALDEIFDEGGAAAAVVQTPAVEPVAAQTETVVAPVQVETPVTPPAAPEGPASDPMAPVKALLDERDRRQAAERRLAEFEARERKAKEAAAAPQAPNILDDPEGYHAYMMNQMQGMQKSFDGRLQSTIIDERLAISEERWSEKLGPEKFAKMNDWIKEMWSKDVHAKAQQQRDPYGWAHQQFEQVERAERAKTFDEKLGGKDLDAYIAEQVAAKLAEAQAAQTPAAEPQRVRNPDGTFASPQTQQRHTPPSLNQITAAAVTNGSGAASALEELYN